MPPRDKILHFNTIARRPFKPPIGQKAIWLPNITLTLLRTSHLPPNFASFIVPLSLNKLDLKDYLWNAYGIPVLSVRSYIQHQPVKNMKTLPNGEMIRKWNRPNPIKKMTVEMGKREEGKNGRGGGLFVWPDMLKEDQLEPWDKDLYDAASLQQMHGYKEGVGQLAHRFEQPGRQSVAEQARRLKEGKDEWRPTWQELRKKD